MGLLILLFLTSCLASAPSPGVQERALALPGAHSRPSPPPPRPKQAASQTLERRKWIWDANCEETTGKEEEVTKGRWIQASLTDCPPAFHDPDFELHSSFCQDPPSPRLSWMHADSLEAMGTESGRCSQMPVSLCPVLARCGPIPLPQRYLDLTR